jgi:PilZ domain
MGQDTGAKPRPTGTRSALSADEVRVFTDRAPRCQVAVAVVCAPTEAGDQVGAELVNISSSGMLVASARPLAVGAEVEFKFQLDDSVVALSGRAMVVRIVSDPVGMGLRFVSLDGSGRDLVDRLIEAGAGAPEVPTAPGHAAAAVEFEHGSVRVRLSAVTAAYFTYNPLLHIGVGGCFLPADVDVPLGTGYQVDILDPNDKLLVRCRAKVAAKQDRRLGLRFLGIDRATLQLLRAEIAKLATTNAP